MLTRKRVALLLGVLGLAVGVCLTAMFLLMLYPPPWQSPAVVRYTYADGRTETVGAFWAPLRRPDLSVEGVSVQLLEPENDLLSGAPKYNRVQIQRFEMWVPNRENRQKMWETLKELGDKLSQYSTAHQLLQALQQHNWQVAHQAFTPQARTRFTPSQLQRRWQALEQAIGQVQGWGMEDFRVYTGTEGHWVQLCYRLEGKAGVGQVVLRLQRVGERWLVETIEVGRSGGR